MNIDPVDDFVKYIAEECRYVYNGKRGIGQDREGSISRGLMGFSIRRA